MNSHNQRILWKRFRVLALAVAAVGLLLQSIQPLTVVSSLSGAEVASEVAAR